MWSDVVLFWFSCQNTNGVNFYNILTQEPDEKLTSSTGGDFICKTLCQVIASTQQFKTLRTAHWVW